MTRLSDFSSVYNSLFRWHTFECRQSFFSFFWKFEVLRFATKMHIVKLFSCSAVYRCSKTLNLLKLSGGLFLSLRLSWLNKLTENSLLILLVQNFSVTEVLKSYKLFLRRNSFDLMRLDELISA